MKTVMDILKEIRPEVNFETSDGYIDNGILDSFDIIALVSTLDENWSITIHGNDIIPENFNSLKSIEEMLKKYGVQCEY